MAYYITNIGEHAQAQVPYIESTSIRGVLSTGYTTSEPSTINITIGDLILEGKGNPSDLRGLRILDEGGDKGPKMEVSYSGNVTIRGINAMDMGTMLRTTNPDGTIYSEGQGILTSTATGETATYTFQGLGQYDSDGTLRDHGSYIFKSCTSTGVELSFLKNVIGVYAKEIDPSGNGIARIWELRWPNYNLAYNIE
jgi:hypothetical protein